MAYMQISLLTTDNYYYRKVIFELEHWKIKMERRPSLAGKLSKKIQDKINSIIPVKIHRAISTAIKQMVRAVLFGSSYTVAKPKNYSSFEEAEDHIQKKIENFKKTAAVEGGVTGAGGILLGFVDFPVLLGIKIKMLYDIAAMYGYDASDYKERLFMLYLFQLAFSSQQHRRTIFEKIQQWDAKKDFLPADIHSFDWQTFQQEYRDHIDLAKMAQLVPGIGALVGVVANYHLLKTLGKTAMNAYRMRILESQNSSHLPELK